MYRFPKEERIIEVLSFKMLLNDAVCTSEQNLEEQSREGIT